MMNISGTGTRPGWSIAAYFMADAPEEDTWLVKVTGKQEIAGIVATYLKE
jgi:hypothetical protein